MEPSTIDGNQDLPAQQNQLGFAENVGFATVASYVQAPPPAPPVSNLATFEDRDITVVPPPLSLIELAAGQTAASVLAQNPGKTLVFESDIFVSGAIQRVIGIR